MVEIHDRGIGLPPEELADINHHLAEPPTVDVAISQRMGLYVVGRLADRHGIRVQLRPSEGGQGTTALAMLPDTITYRGAGTESDVDTMALAAYADTGFPEGAARGYEAWNDR